MSSPFPGMDPCLEMQRDWSDFGPTFLGEIRDELLRHVLPRNKIYAAARCPCVHAG